MSSYSRLDESRDISEKGGSSTSGDAGEEELFLRPTEARWYRYRQAKTWRTWFELHWRTFVMHLILLSVNLTVVTLYAKSGAFCGGELDHVLASSKFLSSNG